MLTSVTGRGWRVGRLGGVELRLDLTVALFAFGILVTTWSGVSRRGAGYAVAATAAVIGMYLAALAIHEVAHLAVRAARRRPAAVVRLWALGEVSEPAAEPEATRSDVAIAVAGIAASAALGAVLVLVARSLPRGHLHHGLEIWGRVNLLIAAANVVPAYGLDANLIARAALRRLLGEPRGSRIALRVSQVFGVLLAAAAFVPHATLDLVPPIIVAAVALLAAAAAGEALPSKAPGAGDPAGAPGEPSEPPETA
jgi:Zn-dependent protease